MNDAPNPAAPTGPTEPRWTHIALGCSDINATIAWFEEFTPLAVISRREDAAGYAAWLGMKERTNNPFILVLAQFVDEAAVYGPGPKTVLGPFAHIGIELPSKEDVDEIAERGERAGCLMTPPTMLPAPIGYITMLQDPDGNVVEFSWDQGVFATMQEFWATDDS